MSRAYFLTGTDTEVGKTLIAAALLRAAAAQGLCALGMKPVAAGDAGDVDALIAAGGKQIHDPPTQERPRCQPRHGDGGFCPVGRAARGGTVGRVDPCRA